YERLEGQRSGFQITFAVIYILVALLFLAAAISIGIHFAAQLAEPISRLMGAAERIRAGDLTARVPEGEKDDELVSLSRAFNRMTYQIHSQQRELIEANRQLDERRRFTEAVLTGVSAGVIGLDRDGRIHLPNRSASALLGVDLDQAIGEDLAYVAPEMAELLEEAARRPERLAQSQVQILGANSTRTLLVRIAAEHEDGDIGGYVVTFDDVTELLSAQRKAAWADIARRIEQAVFLQRTTRPKITFETRFAARPAPLSCDARLVGQAIINIVKNAIESIEGRIAEGQAQPPGRIVVSVGEHGGHLAVTIDDNGKGLPQQDRERLTEPYVTTRAKGTGLGLAIVKKIMEDHRGELILEDRRPIG